LVTLRCFEKVIKPLICVNNLNKEFSYTIEEGELFAQIRTKVHNVPTIGLVATVVKTDITKAMYSNTMNILINSVTLLSHRDDYTASHSARVFYYCSYIAEYMKPSDKSNFSRDLYLASILHDIGKIGVRDSILLKPGKLEQVEFDHLATHPVKGHELLQNYVFLKGAGELVRAHHERPDGKGYPDGLTEDKTPLGAYIISVADSFDAMTSSRPYRTAMNYDDAIREIEINLGAQYQYDIGKAFLNIISPSLVKEVNSSSQQPLSEISKEILASLINTEVQSNDDLGDPVSGNNHRPAE
ncbi:MAG: putative sensor protein, partial [Deltaproteobacteria bacterium]|nr:putative sensor protein [Deltaproteobacteria bacterium]